jgi:hypothetical protein
LTKLLIFSELTRSKNFSNQNPKLPSPNQNLKKTKLFCQGKDAINKPLQAAQKIEPLIVIRLAENILQSG